MKETARVPRVSPEFSGDSLGFVETKARVDADGSENNFHPVLASKTPRTGLDFVLCTLDSHISLTFLFGLNGQATSPKFMSPAMFRYSDERQARTCASSLISDRPPRELNQPHANTVAARLIHLIQTYLSRGVLYIECSAGLFTQSQGRQTSMRTQARFNIQMLEFFRVGTYYQEPGSGLLQGC